ncbi:Lnb N-terminal periplasmic domain-containing protein [Salinisphaera aquimarina]|uniref:DUF4105 domain-containing protein n=1 Tax=Salinisphaera aquimarina TaxID=2094031 RepID=A0ABV7EPC6_9GAMM
MFKRWALVAVLMAAHAPWAYAQNRSDYVDALQARAQDIDLAGSAQWQALLHYEKNWMHGGVHSTVASDWFFFAPDGRTDPAAELDATLAALFANEQVSSRDKPAGCAFVARRKFLVAALDIDTARMPTYDCAEYKQWRRALSPQTISLIFPTAFPNSPSSMFGHTLLRIDSSRRRRGTELLAYAVNFAAAAGEDGHGLGFAWKGLTGGYPGIFGLFPYYEKVKQYAWIEHRDVWSYPLDLDDAEIDRLVDHLWEMDGVRFDYYFLTKNCSYQLLSLLEVARPSLTLTEQYSWYAIPADTIRTLSDVPDLMQTPTFRPSLETQLRWQADQLTPEQRALATGIAADEIALDDGRVTRLDATDHAAVLEVAHDYLYYQLQSGEARERDDQRAARAQRQAHANAILLARSRIPRPSPFARVPAPKTTPDEGHRTLRVQASTVYEADDVSLGFRIRPAYHDLLDAPGGYTAGAQINLLDLGLRLDPQDGELRIQDLTVLNIESLSPRSALFKPVSFQIDTGLRRRPSANVFDDVPNNLGYYFQGGPGLAWGDDDLLGYVFGLGSVDANSALQPGYALGAGASVGVLAHPLRGVQMRLEAGALEYVAGDDGYYRWARATQQFPLTRGLALRSEIGWEGTAVDAGLRAVIGLNAYF